MRQFRANRGKHLFFGMVHLAPLPGAPRYGGDLRRVVEQAQLDAAALVAGGVDGFVIENFGDIPFYPDHAPPETVAAMSSIATRLRVAHPDLLMGVNVLRNDGEAALAIAEAADCDFIRVNILNGARLTDQGLIQGRGHQIMRDRKRLGAERIKVFADVDVKHSAPLAEQSLESQTEDLVNRGGADGLIVSGSGTGKATSADQLKTVNTVADDQLILVGSGVDLRNLAELEAFCGGFIVGTSLKTDGDVSKPVSAERVAEFSTAIRRLA